MNVALIHRHPCCSHRHAAAAHHGWRVGVLGIAALGASMFGVVQTVNQVVFGQAYGQQHVVNGSLTSADSPALAGYGGVAGAKFRPVTDRIFNH